MIQFFYSAMFLLVGMGMPLLAKTTAPCKTTPTPPSKSGTHATLTPGATATAHAKDEKTEKPVIVMTSDRSRANLAATAAAMPAEKAAALARANAKSAPVSAPAPAPAPKQIAKSAPLPKPSHPTKISPVSSVLVTKTSPARGNASSVTPVMADDEPVRSASGERLARVTAYWAAEGDYYTGRCISSTGVRLHDGHCAVDPTIIPYGSVVEISGVGKFLAVDTGSAVISRTAAREGGHNSAERHAIVVDVFFASRRDGEDFAAGAAKFVKISWWTPNSMATAAKIARSLFAEEDWTKIQGKQL